MSFNIALSGINAAQNDLNTTANNISNVATVGFKESRAEFADVFNNEFGKGVATSRVAQQFHQGNLIYTSNELDLAINGDGFFVTTPGGSVDYSYTRAGAFKVDSNSFLVDNDNNFLLAFPVDEDGNSASINLVTSEPVKIPETAGVTVATTDVSMSMNLNASDSEKVVANFNPVDPNTYNNSTSLSFYDSLGESHILTTYFIKPENASHSAGNNWVAFYEIDGKQVDLNGNAGSYQIDTNGDGIADALANAVNANGWKGSAMTFDQDGQFVSTVPGILKTETLGLAGAGVIPSGADGNQQLDIVFNQPTQYAARFDVSELTQNGSTLGILTKLDISPDGLIKGAYSNGTYIPIARIALARFANEQGLSQMGTSNWKESPTSGIAISGEANNGSFGRIQSSTLEQSNVDLTTELVDLISAQRNFQANSRTFEVNNTLQQTILQIR